MNILYIGLGFVFFALGAVGAVLPILPTTPFLLLAAYCFTKGSDRVNNWFIGTRLYNRYLADYVKHRALTVKTKASILILASSMLMLAFFAMHNLYGRIAILVLMAVKYWYFLFRIKTIRPERGEREGEISDPEG